MSVFQRKGSPYYYAEFEIRGHRFLRSTRTAVEREARAEERRLKQKEREKLRQAPPGDRLTLSQGFQRYWNEHGSKLSPTWASEVDRYIACILERADPLLPIEALTDAEVNDFVQTRTAEEGGEYAINRALAVWRAMHHRARKKWRQNTQVIDWSDFMNPESKRVRWLTQEEAGRLLEALPLPLSLAVEWSLYTGCREAETFGLMWASVHMDRGYALVMAKGGRRHTVWLTEQVLDVLVRARIVCTQWAAEVFDTRNKRRQFADGLEKAGIADFCWHDLRHTHATWMRQAGAPLEIVQRSLGHAALSTTERYAHVVDPELREALRRLPSIAPSVPKIVRHPAAKSGG
jgi:integrase